MPNFEFKRVVSHLEQAICFEIKREIFLIFKYNIAFSKQYILNMECTMHPNSFSSVPV